MEQKEIGIRAAIIPHFSEDARRAWRQIKKVAELIVSFHTPVD
jgi:predicted component of type VI protein secretion system